MKFRPPFKFRPPTRPPFNPADRRWGLGCPVPCYLLPPPRPCPTHLRLACLNRRPSLEQQRQALAVALHGGDVDGRPAVLRACACTEPHSCMRAACVHAGRMRAQGRPSNKRLGWAPSRPARVCVPGWLGGQRHEAWFPTSRQGVHACLKAVHEEAMHEGCMRRPCMRAACVHEGWPPPLPPLPHARSSARWGLPPGPAAAA